MTAAERLLLPTSVLEAMVLHALELMPLEAVGILGGTVDGEVRRHFVLPNLLGPRRFLADPYAQYCALCDLDAEGLAPLAVYHSHPSGGVDLSAADLSFARRLPYQQVVIALDRSAVRIAAWAVSATWVRRVAIELLDDGGPEAGSRLEVGRLRAGCSVEPERESIPLDHDDIPVPRSPR